MVLKLGRFGQQIRSTWKVLKCGAWRRTEKISWTDHVRNEEVLLGANEQRNILHDIRKWKANWIGHILRRNKLTCSETSYRRKDKGRDGSDKKTRKKTWEATG